MELIGLIAPTCENSAVKKPKGKTNFYTRWITLLRKTVATCSKDQIISYSHEKGGGGGWGGVGHPITAMFCPQFFQWSSTTLTLCYNTSSDDKTPAKPRQTDRTCRKDMSRHASLNCAPSTFRELFMILSLHCPFVCKHLSGFGRA